MKENDSERIRVDYDDSVNNVISKVNEILATHDICFESDNQAHDGFEIYRLKIIKQNINE